MFKTNSITLFFLFFSYLLIGQVEIPKVYSNISYNADNKLELDLDSIKIVARDASFKYKIADFNQAWKSDSIGLVFDSPNKKLKGAMYFGLIPFGDSKHPQPVYRSYEKIDSGKTAIKIANRLKGRYDMVGWEKSGKGTIGYRIIDTTGFIVYDGIIGFKYDGGFSVDVTVLEGPFVNLVNPTGVTISFRTNKEVVASVLLDGKEFTDKKKTFNHEITIAGLQANKKYGYKIKYGNNFQEYSFKTAPVPGSRKPFVFGYASDCRGGYGGGERNIYGHNAYILKKIMALSTANKTSFLQLTGDIINGYSTSREDMQLQYSNFKRTISPFASYFPTVVGMGNHEALVNIFSDKERNLWGAIDKFPFETESSVVGKYTSKIRKKQ